MAEERKHHWFWTNYTDPSTSHCFFIVLMKGFDKRLAIPNEFFNRYEVELSEIVALNGPSDDTWNVRLTRTKDQVFFEHGWPQFVEDNSLEEFDFLVFRYDGRNDVGNSHFLVLHFDKTGYEKDGEGLDPVDISDNTDGTRDTRFNKDPTSFVHESDNVSSTVNRRGKKKISESVRNFSTTSRTKKNLRRDFARRNATKDEDDGIQQKTKDEDDDIQQKTKDEDDKEYVIFQGETGTGTTKTYNRCFKSHRRPVTPTDIARAFKSALEVKSTKPHFIKVMKPSHVYKKFFLTMPYDFLEEYFSELPKSAILRLRVPRSGKMWSVQITRTTRGAGLNGGWARFVMDNNLEEGDACLFELNIGQETKPSNTNPPGHSVGNVTLDVSIFRVVEKIVPLCKVRVGL